MLEVLLDDAEAYLREHIWCGIMSEVSLDDAAECIWCTWSWSRDYLPTGSYLWELAQGLSQLCVGAMGGWESFSDPEPQFILLSY
jgi:hypothetical protein